MSYPLGVIINSNITHGAILSQRSCLILTQPLMKFSSDSSGPETAIVSTKLYLGIIMLFLLSLLLTIIHYHHHECGRLSMIWIYIRTLLRQPDDQPFHGSLKTLFSILLCSCTLLQIIYGSFLNTERAMMISYDKIETIDALVEKGIIPLRTTLTECPQFVGRKLVTKKFRKVTPDDIINRSPSSTPHSTQHDNDNIHLCMVSERCAIFFSSYEFNLGLPIVCSIHPELVLDHPYHVSGPIESVLLGLLINKNLSRRKLERLNHYVYRTYEMGLLQVRTIFSTDTGVKLAPNPPNRECMEKKIESHVSAPEPLGTEFYGRVLIVYLVLTMIAIIIRIFQCMLSIID